MEAWVVVDVVSSRSVLGLVLSAGELRPIGGEHATSFEM
jgi:hypothetical protein